MNDIFLKMIWACTATIYVVGLIQLAVWGHTFIPFTGG
jgi:hypothetical protein